MPNLPPRPIMCFKSGSTYWNTLWSTTMMACCSFISPARICKRTCFGGTRTRNTLLVLLMMQKSISTTSRKFTRKWTECLGTFWNVTATKLRLLWWATMVLQISKGSLTSTLGCGRMLTFTPQMPSRYYKMSTGQEPGHTVWALTAYILTWKAEKAMVLSSPADKAKNLLRNW